jgi:hypothetical protein
MALMSWTWIGPRFFQIDLHNSALLLSITNEKCEVEYFGQKKGCNITSSLISELNSSKV